MLFDRKFDRALEHAKEMRADSPPALTDESLGSKLEKGDVPAMILSALIVIVPTALVALLAVVMVGYFFIVR